VQVLTGEERCVKNLVDNLVRVQSIEGVLQQPGVGTAALIEHDNFAVIPDIRQATTRYVGLQAGELRSPVQSSPLREKIRTSPASTRESIR
jgi:hypothetical protein